MIFLNKKYKKLPKDGQFIYFLQIGEPSERVFKIGTTNNMHRRMKQHETYYKKDITVIWYKKVTSKYTTLRVEDENKDFWLANTNWKYKRNDRFIIPELITEVVVKIRKKYDIKLSCECYEVDKHGNNMRYYAESE